MLTFAESEHKYEWDGKPVLSVTQIIDAAGISSYSDVSRTLAFRLAGEFGKMVHLACEFDDKGTLDDATIDPQIYPSLLAWRKFKADFNLVPMLNEARVYSSRHNYAGTVDRAARCREWTAIIDIKTGAKCREHGVQLSAYDVALREFSGFKAEKLLTVRLDGEQYFIDDYTADKKQNFAVFQAALMIARWKQNNK